MHSELQTVHLISEIFFFKKKNHFKNAQKGFKLGRNPGVQLVRDRCVYALHIQNITLKILLQKKNLKKGAVNGRDEFTSSKKMKNRRKERKPLESWMAPKQ